MKRNAERKDIKYKQEREADRIEAALVAGLDPDVVKGKDVRVIYATRSPYLRSAMEGQVFTPDNEIFNGFQYIGDKGS
jgi:hypothetical protein